METQNENTCAPRHTTRRNSQQQVIDYLQTVECATESEIQQACWNYHRNSKFAGSNKKYADLLRRALHSGKIHRLRMRFKNRANPRYYWYYFLPTQAINFE